MKLPTASSLPHTIQPMLAMASDPFSDPQCIFEVKWDGLRCIAFINGTTRLQARSLRDYTERFPELVDMGGSISKSGVVLDGEIVTFYQGKPSFLRLQPRVHARNSITIGRLVRETPAVFVAFDVLYVHGEPVMNLPLFRRRELLEDLVEPSPTIQVSQGTMAEGRVFFDAVKAMGLEGVVGKRLDSTYMPGKRTYMWRKVKAAHKEVFSICGYTTNPTGRMDLSALGLAADVAGTGLVFFGMVGTGLSQAEIDRLLSLLKPLAVAEPPHFAQARAVPKGIHWVRLELVCEVEYLELTGESHLRHPLYKGLRTDLHYEDCVKT